MKKSLMKDVLQTVGSIHRMNAPYAIGYLFNSTRTGNEIANGMYCDRISEIDYKSWEYFLAFENITRKEKGCNSLFFQIKKGQFYLLKENKDKTLPEDTILEETNINLMEALV